MAVETTSTPILFTFLLFLFMLTKFVKSWNSTRKLPPGPWKLPLIGNMHQLIFGSLPHELLRNLAQKYGPLMYLKLGEVSTVVVSSPEIAEELLKTHDLNFSQRPHFLAPQIISYDCTGIAFAPYGAYWRQLRKICTTALLSAKRVQSFRSIREEEVTKLIKNISLHEKSLINLSEMIFSLTYGMTSRAAFGANYNDQGEFMSAFMEVSRLSAGLSVADMYPSIKLLQLATGLRRKLEKEHRTLDVILERIINEHKKGNEAKMSNEEEDLVDVLLKVQKSGDLEVPLSDDNMKAVILDMFSGGSETSSTLVEWALSEMLKNPKVMEKAQAEVRETFRIKGRVDEGEIHELRFLKCVIKETIRLHPSLPLIPRECCTNSVINGYNIPVKTKVLVNTWAIGRDPKHWTEAERFYPERFLDSSIDYKGTNFKFIPFGTGRRICPGISFAQANTELPLAQLLYHFDWKLPNGMNHEDLDMTEAYGLTVRRKRDLFLVPILYHPAA